MNGTEALPTLRQLRELLQVDRVTIYRMLQDGRLQGFKVGGQWRFSRQAIESWLQGQRDSLHPPVPSPLADGLVPAPEALPLSCIGAIQEIFAQALGVGAVTVTANGTPLTAVANCPEFCDLILRSPAGWERCIVSWRASAAEPRRAPRPAKCHAGLHYMWGWIVVQGIAVAAAHAGQYLEPAPTDDSSTASIEELAATCGQSSEGLLHAWQRVPVLDEERQQQLARLLQRMTAIFAEIGEERHSLLSRLQSIAKMTQL